VVGLEIKREILVGELASLRQAALPIAAAVGGMVVPALFYTAVNAGSSGSAGWGIPMATDIAFALGVMALVGQRVPLALKVVLTALAIVDDIGAVLVIALFYSSSVSWSYLAAAGVILAVLAAMSLFGVRKLFFYAVLGIALWVMVLNSGLHATLAGILLAVTIPANRKIEREKFVEKLHGHVHAFERAGEANPRLLSPEQQEVLIALESDVEDVEAPLQKMEHALHPWVAFAIIPLFALANAGVSVGGNLGGLLLDRVSLGIIAGLVLGKQIGITLASWLAVKLRLAELPAGVNWRQIYATGWLAGIGFTMSLFIAELAFGASANLEAAKVGILGASLVAGITGFVLLRAFSGKKG
jgi:NhaA family Na+:H+ antiporter